MRVHARYLEMKEQGNCIGQRTHLTVPDVNEVHDVVDVDQDQDYAWGDYDDDQAEEESGFAADAEGATEQMYEPTPPPAEESIDYSGVDLVCMHDADLPAPNNFMWDPEVSQSLLYIDVRDEARVCEKGVNERCEKCDEDEDLVCLHS